MLKKYEMFIQSLNESVVFYSDAFRKIIKNINDPVASALLDLESKDLEVARNYIDIDADDKNKITFIPDARAKRLQEEKSFRYLTGTSTGFLANSSTNKQIFDDLGFVPTGERQYRPQPNEVGKLIKMTTRPSGNSYCYLKFEGGESVINKRNLEEVGTVDLFTASGRQSGKIGSNIKTFLSSVGKNFTDREIELFVNSYKSEYERANDIFSKFEIVEGKDIGFWYHGSRYEKISGTLGSSCMRGHNKEFFVFYNNNPDKVKLLILKSETDGEIKGRALVWFLDDPQGVVFVDRVYYIEDSDADLFRKYAIEKGWVQKRINSSTSNAGAVGKDGVVYFDKISVKLKKELENGFDYSYSMYPYMDTLKYYNTETGELTNYDDKGYITLECTDGSFGSTCEECEGTGSISCGECGGDGWYGCYGCSSTGRVECSDCEGTCKEECGDCDGSGEVDGEECDTCDGTGKENCSECGGEGEHTCGDCDGDGRTECYDCSGSGEIDCPECS